MQGNICTTACVQSLLGREYQIDRRKERSTRNRTRGHIYLRLVSALRFCISAALGLTSHVIKAAVLGDLEMTGRTRARNLLDGFEELWLLFNPPFPHVDLGAPRRFGSCRTLLRRPYSSELHTSCRQRCCRRLWRRGLLDTSQHVLSRIGVRSRHGPREQSVF